MFLEYFYVINGFVIDYMYGVCVGVMKLLLVFWFDKKYKNELFLVFYVVFLVSSRLKLICLNLIIIRFLRFLSDFMYWKIFEFRNFLFLWSLFVLYGVLLEFYYVYFCLFVKVIYILFKECIM